MVSITRIATLSVALSMTFLAGHALAAGYYNLDQGIESFAQGASMVAKPGNASAVYLNPAGLIDVVMFGDQPGRSLSTGRRRLRV